MPYGLIYRGEWLMADDLTEVRVDITDTTVIIPSGEPEIRPLQMGANPLTVSVIDNDKDKLTPVRAKQAVIEIKTENGIDITTFTGGADIKFLVEATIIGGDTIFTGHLVSADISQPFLPNKQTLVLTASDGLGLLKDVDWTDFDDNNPTGKHKIAQCLAYALSKTGLSLPIHVVNNLRHGTGARTVAADFSGTEIEVPLGTDMFYVGQRVLVTGTGGNNVTVKILSVTHTGVTTLDTDVTFVTESAPAATFTDESSQGHFYDTIYLDAKTFEDQIGTSENCYSVLEKILAEDCYLTQYKGAWWIIRLDEFDENDIYVSIFDSDGTFSSNEAPTTYNKEIGEAEDLRFCNADDRVDRDLPLGFAKLTFNHNTPLEIPCNRDFSRGTVIDESNPLEKTYLPECWKLRRGLPGAYGDVEDTTVAIHKIYDERGYDRDKYIVLTPRVTAENSSTTTTYLESESIPVQAKDKFTASIQFRLASNIGTGGGRYRLFRFVLHGDDGSWWIMGRPSDTAGTDNTVKWYDTSNMAFQTGRGSTEIDFDDTEEIEWKTIDWEAPAIPVTGKLYIWLNQFNQISGGDDDVDVWYTALNFDYIPYINGSYRKFTGQYQKVSRVEAGYLSKRDKEVQMSDSPKPIFKGSMFVVGGYDLLYGGAITFGATGFSVPGDLTNTILPGMHIRAGATVNDVTGQVISVTYNIIGNTTAVIIDGTVVEIAPFGTVSEVIFGLTTWFYPANVFPSGPPDITYVHPYGELQIRSVWNQYVYPNWKHSGAIMRIGEDWPDLIHKYLLTDAHPSTVNRYFVLTGFEQDWKTGIMRINAAECYDRILLKRYDDPREFKLIE